MMKFGYVAKMLDGEGFRVEHDVESEEAGEAYAKEKGYDLLHVKRITIVTCCGEDIECTSFTNTCDHCEADYNFAGQLLAPRSQWGEETGEDWGDCY